jgi:AcrR family transcriptional regulator
MVARAEAAAATRERILDAAVEAFWNEPTTDIPLDRIAETAGVTVQTVLRHFGSRDGLFDAAGDRESSRIQDQRETPVGDIERAVRVLVDHYEEMGDRVMRLLSEEERMPGLKPVVDAGRAAHRAWCGRVFVNELVTRHGVDRRRLLAQLVAICDVYTWKLLRRDSGLSRRQTELALIEMLDRLLEVK